MSANRPPAVAGRFYPGDPQELSGLIQQFLAESPGDPRPAPAAIVPHAGLVYSGACAARVFQRLVLGDTVVILAPNHTGYGEPDRAGVWPSGAFATPLGLVAVDEELAGALLTHADLAVDDRAAHRYEHAIEVELPFLQILAPSPPGVLILPVIVPWVDWGPCRRLADVLGKLIAAHRDRQVTVVASSDMTHYEPAARAAVQDELALDRVRALDGAGLLEVCRRRRITMCGRGPAAVAVEVARQGGARGAEVIDYRHSGDVTGDNASVVAYAGVILS